MKRSVIRLIAVLTLITLAVSAAVTASAATGIKINSDKKLNESVSDIKTRAPKLPDSVKISDLTFVDPKKDDDIKIAVPSEVLADFINSQKDSESGSKTESKTDSGKTPKKLKITKQPVDTTVKKGGTAKFSAACQNDTGITWHFVGPEGEEILAKDIGSVFKGVTVTGKNSDRLTVKKVPEDMHGWGVYCTYSNKLESKDTEMAHLWIKGMEEKKASEPTEADTETTEETEEVGSSFVYTGDDALVVTVVGATLEADGADGDTLDFSDNGSADFKVTCKKAPSYWVINGARYDFKKMPKTITVKDLTYPMTIEAVMKGKKPTTLLSDEQLQAKRTGDPLIVTDVNADLCFITAKGTGKGGWFDEFDFTEDFQNKATGKTEQGGRVTLRCKAYLKNKKDTVSYWKFNDAKLYFNTNVTEFVVRNLNETMEYHPVVKAAAQKKEEKTPEATVYKVTCTNCTFTGGGYTDATSGEVAPGTQITVKRKGGIKVEYWKVNRVKRGHDEMVDEVVNVTEDGQIVFGKVKEFIADQADTIKLTINRNTTVVCELSYNPN